MLRIVVVLVILVGMAPAALAQPIARVYRTDTRPPEVVFRDGLHGAGQNTDVLEHALGGSCEETDPVRASAWVSMSYDRDQAVGFAEGHLGADTHPVVWLYTIRPDDTYYSVENMMREAIDTAELANGVYTPDHARILHWLIARSPIRTEREIIANHVAPANIVEALPVRYVGDELTFGPGVSNPHFVNANTTVGVHVGTLLDVIPLGSIRMSIYDDDNALSCSMSCDGSTTSSSWRAAGRSTADAFCKVYRKQLLTPVMQLLLSN